MDRHCALLDRLQGQAYHVKQPAAPYDPTEKASPVSDEEPPNIKNGYGSRNSLDEPKPARWVVGGNAQVNMVEVRGTPSNRNLRVGLVGGNAQVYMVEVRGTPSNRNLRVGLVGGNAQVYMVEVRGTPSNRNLRVGLV